MQCNAVGSSICGLGRELVLIVVVILWAIHLSVWGDVGVGRFECLYMDAVDVEVGCMLVSGSGRMSVVGVGDLLFPKALQRCDTMQRDLLASILWLMWDALLEASGRL
jgi:hypothetical protein